MYVFGDVLMRCFQSNTAGTVPTPYWIQGARTLLNLACVMFCLPFFYQGQCAFSCFLKTSVFILLRKWLGQISKLSSSLKVFQSQILISLPNKTMQCSSPQGSEHSLHLFLQTLQKSMCTQPTMLISLIVCLFSFSLPLSLTVNRNDTWIIPNYSSRLN